MKWLLVLTLLGGLLTSLMPKMSFEVEPRVPTFAYPTKLVAEHIPQDVEDVCFGYLLIEQFNDYDELPARWETCLHRPENGKASVEYKLVPGTYDVFLLTYNWRGKRLDYRTKRIAVK